MGQLEANLQCYKFWYLCFVPANILLNKFVPLDENLNKPKVIRHPSQDSSIGSRSAWYRGGPGFKSRTGNNFSVKIRDSRPQRNTEVQQP